MHSSTDVSERIAVHAHKKSKKSHAKKHKKHQKKHKLAQQDVPTLPSVQDLEDAKAEDPSLARENGIRDPLGDAPNPSDEAHANEEAAK